jgi:tyrosine decarboxylase/aspartate 1-decarboxylase
MNGISSEIEQLRALQAAVTQLLSGFERLPTCRSMVDLDAVEKVLLETATRLQDNYPFHHPLYVGQMLKPPHPIARLSYALTMWLNPNNHALDGGPVGSKMEKEVVQQLAQMLDWSAPLGHLCGGGTIANLEALWVARELDPGRVVVASQQAHYTHARVCGVLQQPFESIPVAANGRMDLDALERRLGQGDVGTVVATLGTTAAGALDPLAAICDLRDRYGFRLHVDAAYGGYFRLVDNLDQDACESLAAISQADSVVIDPHKHGLQPYGCGCVLFRDQEVASVYQHDSPYTYFTADDLHLGEISLECSRSGAAAIALWATMRLLPLSGDGEFAQMLRLCRQGAIQLYEWLQSEPHFEPLMQPDLDIVVWCVQSPIASESSQLARQLFQAAAKHDLHLALAEFPRQLVESTGAIETWDVQHVTCLRACVMKPDHVAWLPEITQRLQAACRDVLQ